MLVKGEGMKCPYNDCGWCYHTHVNAFQTGGQCIDPMLCPEYGKILKIKWNEFLEEREDD